MHLPIFKHLLIFAPGMEMSVVCCVDVTHFVMLLLR